MPKNGPELHISSRCQLLAIEDELEAAVHHQRIARPTTKTTSCPRKAGASKLVSFSTKVPNLTSADIT